MSNEIISIIVPVYNVELYIQKCIESIINQTYKNLDIILINDGSIDRSGDICEEMAKSDNRIRIIHVENGGQAKARNIGLDMAVGEYIGFVDSDDYIQNDMYEIMIDNALAENAEIVQIGYWILSPEGKITNTIKKDRVLYSSFRDCLKAYIEDSTIVPAVWDKLYHKSMWKKIRMPEGYYYEDGMVLLELFKITKKLLVIEDVGYYYVQSKQSTQRGVRNTTHLKSCIYEPDFYYDYLYKYAKDFIDYAIVHKCHRSMRGYRYLQNIKGLSLEEHNTYSKKFLDRFTDNYSMLKSTTRFNNISKSMKIAFLLFSISPKIYLLLYNVFKH